jgi:DNA-binding response OmpR family regulator
MPEPRRREPCVLIVEDFVDAREMYQLYLEHEGFCVYTAANAVVGIALAIEHRPELIIMDAGLPGMTGWDAVEEIKADERLKDTPVFMLTGHVLTDSRDRARAVGADGFIAKPCLPDELLKIIKTALSDSGEPAPWPTEEPRIATSPELAAPAGTRKKRR